MNTMFMNSRNRKTSDPRRLLLNLTDKIDLRRKDKYIALSNLSIYYTRKTIKKSHKNNKSKISSPTWKEEFGYNILKYNIQKTTCYSVHPRDQIFVKSHGFFPFAKYMGKNVGKKYKQTLK